MSRGAQAFDGTYTPRTPDAIAAQCRRDHKGYTYAFAADDANQPVPPARPAVNPQHIVLGVAAGFAVGLAAFVVVGMMFSLTAAAVVGVLYPVVRSTTLFAD